MRAEEYARQLYALYQRYQSSAPENRDPLQEQLLQIINAAQSDPEVTTLSYSQLLQPIINEILDHLEQ